MEILMNKDVETLHAIEVCWKLEKNIESVKNVDRFFETLSKDNSLYYWNINDKTSTDVIDSKSVKFFSFYTPSNEDYELKSIIASEYYTIRRYETKDEIELVFGFELTKLSEIVYGSKYGNLYEIKNFSKYLKDWLILNNLNTDKGDFYLMNYRKLFKCNLNQEIKDKNAKNILNYLEYYNFKDSGRYIKKYIFNKYNFYDKDENSIFVNQDIKINLDFVGLFDLVIIIKLETEKYKYVLDSNDNHSIFNIYNNKPFIDKKDLDFNDMANESFQKHFNYNNKQMKVYKSIFLGFYNTLLENLLIIPLK